MRFKVDRASLIVGSKFTSFSLFYFVFEGNFLSTSPWGAYIWRGDLTAGFSRYRFGGLIFVCYHSFQAASWWHEITSSGHYYNPQQSP